MNVKSGVTLILSVLLPLAGIAGNVPSRGVTPDNTTFPILTKRQYVKPFDILEKHKKIDLSQVPKAWHGVFLYTFIDLENRAIDFDLNFEDPAFQSALQATVTETGRKLPEAYSDEVKPSLLKTLKLAPFTKLFNAQESEILKNTPEETKRDPAKLIQYLEDLQKQKPHYHPYPVSKLLTQAMAWAELRKLDRAKLYPFEAVWRMCIDGHRQELGAYAFESETRYMEGCLRGLVIALRRQQLPFTAKEHELLRYNMIRDVVHDLPAIHGRMLFDKALSTTNYVSNVQLPGIYMKDRDHIGLSDIEQRSKFFGFDDRNGIIIGQFGSPQYKEAQMNRLIAQHDAYIHEHPGAAHRLIAHLWLVREIELRHFFMDANLRTANMALVRLVADDSELPLFWLDNPFVLHANGPEKLSYRALQAMLNFEHFGVDKPAKENDNELKLADLKLNDHYLEALREGLIKVVSGKDWAYFHHAMEDALENQSPGFGFGPLFPL